MSDVAVVGGGIAGLAAALTARAAGADVTVYEKSAVAGGNARLSAGMFLGARDFAGLARYIPDGDPQLLRALCAEYDAALAWLESLGLPLESAIDYGDFRIVRPMGTGMPGAREPFMDRLAACALGRGVKLVLETGVTRIEPGFRLHLSDGRTARARAVILATGGFAASPATLATYLGADAAHLFARTRPGAAGDGLALALSQGAATSRNMQAFYGHTLPDCDLPRSEWQPLTPYFARIGILVNRAGRRFTDESESLLEETNPQVAYRQPGGRYWLVFDERIRRGDGIDNGTSARLPPFDWLARARAHAAPIHEASTVRELVDALATDGVDRSVAGEIEAYNAACHGRGPFAVARATNRYALESPPFYALRCKPAITATCGGIAVDAQLRVLDAAGRPLASLFAAGVDAGGVYGRTYGGFLTWALVSGRRAGATAAL